MNIPEIPRKYAAFISYRHADNKESGRQWASWLHHTLETFEVPPDLIGKTNLRGDPVPASLYPIFRDEEELPADADLTANIQLALQNSSLLVVLCSPRAVASRFVADEIRYFKEIGRSNRILALIIDGEPNVSEDSAKQAAGMGRDLECLPHPLRYGVVRLDGSVNWKAQTEPIAADARPGGRPEQGFTSVSAYRESLRHQNTLSSGEITGQAKEYEQRLELARLKVIAGALGLPLGDLTQRDKVYQLAKEQRRARTLRRWLVVVAVLALAALGAGIMAVRQANIARETALAEKQARQEATHHLATALLDRARMAQSQGDLLTAAQSAVEAWKTENTSATRTGAWEHLLSLPTELPAYRYSGSSRGTVCLLPEGSVAIAGGDEISIWGPTGEKTGHWEYPAQNVVGLVSAGNKDIWVLDSGGLLLLARGDGGMIETAHFDGGLASLAVSPSAGCLAIGTKHGEVLYFPSVTLPIPQPLRWQVREGINKSVFVGLSPDGEIVYASLNGPDQQGLVAACRARTGEIIWQRQVDRPARIALSPDGKYVAWYTMDGTIEVAAADGRLVQHIEVSAAMIGWIGFSPDGQRLAFAHDVTNRSDGVVEILEVASGRTRRVYDGVGSVVTAIFATPQRLLAGGLGKGYWVDLPPARLEKLTDELVWKIRPQHEGNGVLLFSHGRPNWLDASEDELSHRLGLRQLALPLEFWPSVRGQGKLFSVTEQFAETDLPSPFRFISGDRLSDGRAIVGAADGGLVVNNPSGWQVVRTMPHPIRHLQSGPDGLVIYGLNQVGAAEGVLRFSGNDIQEVAAISGHNLMTASLFSPDGRMVYVAHSNAMGRTNDAQLTAVNLLTGETEVETDISSCGTIRDLLLTGQRHTLVAALASGELAEFSLPDLRIVRRSTISNAELFRLAEWSSPETILLAGDAKGVLHLVDEKSGAVLYRTGRSDQPVTALTVVNNTWWVAFGNRVERWQNVAENAALQDGLKTIRYHSATDLQQLAAQVQERGDLDQALDYYSRLAAINPTDAATMTEIVRIQRHLDRFDDALATVDQIIAAGQSQNLPRQILAVYGVMKGQIAYQQWQATGNQEALVRAACEYEEVLLKDPTATAFHLAMLSLLLDSGHADLGLRACRLLLPALNGDEKEIRERRLDLAQAWFLCALQLGEPVTEASEWIKKTWAEGLDSPDQSLRDLWLSDATAGKIQWKDLPARDQAKLHVVVGTRSRNQGRRYQAQKHFRAGIEAGDWHGFNQRALDDLNGRPPNPPLPSVYLEPYGWVLDFLANDTQPESLWPRALELRREGVISVEILHLMGEQCLRNIQRTAQDLQASDRGEEALRKWEAGLTISTQTEPPDLLAEATFSDGLVLCLDTLGRLDQALQKARKTLPLLERVATLKQGDASSQVELANAFLRFGDLFNKTGHETEASAAYGKGLYLVESALRSSPEDAEVMKVQQKFLAALGREEAEVVVISIKPGSQAEGLGIRPGDVIARYGELRIINRMQLLKVVSDAGKNPGARLQMTILRGNESVILPIQSGALGINIEDRFPKNNDRLKIPSKGDRFNNEATPENSP